MANKIQHFLLSIPGVKELASNLVAIGDPNMGAPSNAQDTFVAGTLPAMTGAASQRLKLTRKEIPKLEEVEALVGYIKSWRSQLKIRKPLTEAVETVVEGFRLKGSPELERFSVAQRLNSKVGRIVLELLTVGWVVVYVSEDPKAMPTITLLHNVDIKRDVLGNDVIYLMLSDDATKAVQANPQAYPTYWSEGLGQPSGINITRVMDNNGKVTQGAAYFLTIGHDDEDMLPIPPVFPWLPDVVDSEKIGGQIGSFVDFLKWYLIHARVGDKVGSDQRDGRPKPPSKERLTAVLQSLSVGYKAGAMVTPADVEVDYRVLKDDPFAIIRNDSQKALSSFRKNVGAPDFDSASSEGAAMYMARGFMPTVSFLRRAVVEQFLQPLLYDLASQGRMPGAEDARVLWGDTLNDLGARINLAKFKQSTGGYSLQTLCETVDPDYSWDREIKLKTTEFQNKDLIGNVYEISQGQSVLGLEAAKTSSKPTDPANSGKTGKTKPAGDQTQATPDADPGGRPPK